MKIDVDKIIQEMIDQPAVVEGTGADMAKELMLSREELEAILENLRLLVEGIVADRTTSVSPLYVVYCHGNEGKSINFFGIESNFNEGEEKELVGKSVAISLYEQNKIPIMIGFLAEAWQVVYHKDEERPAIQPRHDTRREEVVVASVLTLDAQCLATNRRIKRLDDDIMDFDGDWMLQEGALAVSPLLAEVFRQVSKCMADPTAADRMKNEVKESGGSCRIVPVMDPQKGDSH